MMKVLVVDDEPIIRQVLKTMIRWEEHGFQWGGEACDGKEAWDRLEDGGIDLVVTDILMPRMDGLELVRKMKQSESDVAVIVLSCLDDFTYVKEAMKLGACDYILKPTMEPEQLVTILKEARLDLQKQREQKQRQLMLTQQLMQSNQAQWGLRIKKTWVSGQRDEELEEALLTDVERVSSWMIYLSPDVHLSFIGSDWPDVWAYVIVNEHQVLLIYKDGLNVIQQEQRQAQLQQSLLRKDVGLTEKGFWLSAVTWINPKEQLYHIVHMHDELRKCYFYGVQSAQLNHTSEVRLSGEMFTDWKGELPQEEKHNLLRAIAGHNEDAVVHWSEQIMERLGSLQPPVVQASGFLYELLNFSAALARQEGTNNLDDFDRKVAAAQAQAYFQLETLGKWFSDACRELVILKSGTAIIPTSRNPFVRKAQQYMKQNYHLPISTSDIAEYVKLSRSYMSDLYSKETGESLIESLVRIRLEAAKQLLLATNKKVYEVAEAVGFTDAKVFAKTFKKAVGCTPKEYEEQNK
ncbi:Two-component response regulator, YesN/AraC family, consists of REC and AraC-type DNA-binding domains [Paenibacillus sp. 1_12]|uniref:response regulator n=1 Tax=Paenibacillus sp. 1_12 TaxID=1566278 RepID=UPI0008E59918|nr:response regulator [Paenibacillus sp. 1_12]SFL83146.1 Two-component response regulator, YesN/AraC family, consists of REC and AraC-type DNA-binding domains [Paenibacillus sp. 1_12]